MAEEERILNKDYSERRASLMIAYGLNLLINANKSEGDPKEKTLLKLLEKLIIKEDNCTESEKKHLKEMQHLIYSSQAGPKDIYFKKLHTKLLTTTLGKFDSNFSEVEDLILDLVPKMIIRDMLSISPKARQSFINEESEYSEYITHLISQAEKIGLEPVDEMPECLNETMTIFRPNILYAGHRDSLSGGKVEFIQTLREGLWSCSIDFTIEDVITEKQVGILTRSPDGNFVLLTQISKDSNKAFQNTQMLWQINYDFGKSKSGSFKTITHKPSYFDNEWFVLTSCSDARALNNKQFQVKDLPLSTHIAVSRFINSEQLIIPQKIYKDVDRDLKTITDNVNSEKVQ